MEIVYVFLIFLFVCIVYFMSLEESRRFKCKIGLHAGHIKDGKLICHTCMGEFGGGRFKAGDIISNKNYKYKLVIYQLDKYGYNCHTLEPKKDMDNGAHLTFEAVNEHYRKVKS